MKYKLVDDKYLYLEFRVAGEPNVLKETWVKVIPPAAREKGKAVSMQKQREDGAYFVREVMLPWTPGTVDGKAVPVVYNVPINFILPAVPKTKALIAAHSSI